MYDILLDDIKGSSRCSPMMIMGGRLAHVTILMTSPPPTATTPRRWKRCRRRLRGTAGNTMGMKMSVNNNTVWTCVMETQDRPA
jgi:hypothetical protein